MPWQSKSYETEQLEGGTVQDAKERVTMDMEERSRQGTFYERRVSLCDLFTSYLTQSQPKRPLSAYNLFFKDVRKRLLKENDISTSELSIDSGKGTEKSIGFGPLAKRVAAEWTTLSTERKIQYAEMAAEEKQQYRVKIELWIANKDSVTLQKKKAINDVENSTQQQHLTNEPVLETFELSKRSFFGQPNELFVHESKICDVGPSDKLHFVPIDDMAVEQPLGDSTTSNAQEYDIEPYSLEQDFNYYNIESTQIKKCDAIHQGQCPRRLSIQDVDVLLETLLNMD